MVENGVAPGRSRQLHVDRCPDHRSCTRVRRRDRRAGCRVAV